MIFEGDSLQLGEKRGQPPEAVPFLRPFEIVRLRL
jgi:hypothetical protein